jgi:hypothetical protein
MTQAAPLSKLKLIIYLINPKQGTKRNQVSGAFFNPENAKKACKNNQFAVVPIHIADAEETLHSLLIQALFGQKKPAKHGASGTKKQRN